MQYSGDFNLVGKTDPLKKKTLPGALVWKSESLSPEDRFLELTATLCKDSTSERFCWLLLVEDGGPFQSYVAYKKSIKVFLQKDLKK